jgi:transketolase
VIGQSSFGASAPAAVLAEHFGFSPQNVAKRVRTAL